MNCDKCNTDNSEYDEDCKMEFCNTCEDWLEGQPDRWSAREDECEQRRMSGED